MPQPKSTAEIPVVIGLDVLSALLRIGARAQLSTSDEDRALKAMYVVACNAQQLALHPNPWQWSERSSLTSLLTQLLELAPEAERHAIVCDLAENLRS